MAKKDRKPMTEEERKKAKAAYNRAYAERKKALAARGGSPAPRERGAHAMKPAPDSSVAFSVGDVRITASSDSGSTLIRIERDARG